MNNAFSDQAEFLAAPGTWAGATTRAGSSVDVAADAFLYTGDVDPRQAQALASGLAVTPLTRRDEIEVEPRTWIDRSPFAYRVPAALLPALAGAASLLLSRRRVESFHGGLLDVGASRRRATTVLGVAGSVAMVVAGVVGVVGGAVAGAAGAYLMAQLAVHPVHVALPAPLGVLSAVLPAVIGWLAALLIVGRSRTARRSASLVTRVKSRHGALIRDSAILGLLALSTVLTVVGGRSPAEAMVLAALLGVLTALAGPRILGLLARALPEGDPAIRWVRRSITAPRSATPLSFALLLALMVPCITTAVFVNLSGSQTRADALSDVGPGQVAVHGVGGLATPPPEGLRQVAENALPGLQPQDLMWVDGFLSMEFPNAAILVVPDAQDVARILGSGMTPGDVERVGAGGTLYWGADTGAGVTVSTAAGDTDVTQAIRVEGVSEEWQTQSGAIMTLKTAQRSGLPLIDGGLLFSGATPQQMSSLYAAIDAAGLDRRTVSAYQPPRAVLPPLALIASGVLLALVVVTVATATSGTRTTLMRPVAAQFVAQGGSRRDVRRLVLTEQALVLTAAAGAALLIALSSAGVLLIHNSGLDLNLQAWPIVGVVLAAGAGQVLAALGALKGLRANDAGPVMLART